MTNLVPALASDHARPRRLRQTALVLVGLVVLALLIARTCDRQTVHYFVDQRQAIALKVAAHPMIAAALFVGFYGLTVALSVPGATLLTLAGGFLFGGFLGGILADVSATSGGAVLFVVARKYFGAVLPSRYGGGPAGMKSRLDRVRSHVEAHAVSYLLFLRLTPVVPFWMVNLALAPLKVPLSTFVWTTAIGIAPATFALAFAGQGLDSIVEAHRVAYEACQAAGQAHCSMGLGPSKLITREVMVGLAGLGVAALIPVFVRAIRWALAARRAREARP